MEIYINVRFVGSWGRWPRPPVGTTDLKAVVGQPQLAQQRRGCSLRCAQCQASHPHAPAELTGKLQVLLEAVELTAGLFAYLRRCAEVTNMLPASATEPQLDHLLARSPPFQSHEPALPKGLAVRVAQCEPSKRGELGGEIT